MAGKLRIKISLEHVEPFWMFVSTKETPNIVDIHQKIEQRVENVKVASLFLDGCLLPADETTELLRDNDTVQVICAECEDEPFVSSSSPAERHRKRKCADEDSDYFASETQVWQTTEKASCSGLKKKKKSRKEKLINASGSHNSFEKQRKNDKGKKKKLQDKNVTEQDNDTVFVENEGVPALSAPTVSSPKEKLINASGSHNLFEKQCKNNKEKKKKLQNKNVTEQDSDTVLIENEAVPVHSTPTVKKPTEGKDEASSGTQKVTPKASDTSITNSSLIEEITDSLVVEKRKKRRRQKKKVNAKNQAEAEKNSAKTQTVLRQPPAELRLPKWQQAKNKKIVFSSDGESTCDAGASVDQTSKQALATDRNKDKESQASEQRDIPVSDHNSSFSDSFPSGNAENSNAGRTNLRGAEKVPDMNMSEDGAVCASVNASAGIEECVDGENGEDEWYRNQQYQEKLREERNQKHRCASALDKSLIPVHLYTGGQHEVVQPNLAEYLKLSPEERGAEVPPYVTATRLANGAMLYSRCSGTAGADRKTPSPFKKPAAYTPAKASPRALSKQQQFETLSTNRSIVVQNPPSSNTDVSNTEIDNHRDENGLSEERERVDNYQETIVLTPVCREYSLFPGLIAAPKVGDHIAYKVLEMGDDYTPGISDYKEAEVLGYDASSQNVTVKLHRFNTKKKIPGKFDLPEEEPVEDQVTLELSSMFEPKLISSH